MSRLTLRVAFGVVAAVALYAVVSTMAHLPTRIDGALAVLAVVVFAYYFERDEPRS